MRSRREMRVRDTGKEVVLTGSPASPGYAQGQIFPLQPATARYRPKDSPTAETAALHAALAAASEQIANLIARSEPESAAILEFQLAMLEDDALSGPALAAIHAGETAWDAWTSVLDGEIAGYDSSDDGYFRARAADMRDIRDQVLRALSGKMDRTAPAGSILFGDDIAPTRFLDADWSDGGGIALTAGSAASHVAMLARAKGVPMVVGLGDRLGHLATPMSGLALLDAVTGRVMLDPDAAAMARFELDAKAYASRIAEARSHLERPAATRDGSPVRVLVNIADPSDVDAIDIAHCDGVGLMRTEFLFGAGLPDEDTQYRAYRRVLEWAGDKPVTIRTVDAGGDKPVQGFTVAEGNPFLGLRGIRLSLARPDVFRVQIRALLRAGAHGNLKVMLPMISVRSEYERAAALFAEERSLLARNGMEHRLPPLGIMVEVPSAALAPEEFAGAAFFSIGSNDLTQYVMAAARDNGAVASLNDVLNPAVLRLVAQVADYGQTHGMPVSLCGDAGGDPRSIPALLNAGLRELSVVPAQLAMAKAAIADVAL